MNQRRRFLPPASRTGGLSVNGRLMVYGTAELPEDFPLRDVLGVGSKQMRRWRKGIEPCGGAMMSIFWVASQVPGGLDLVMGEGFVSSLIEG